MINTLYYMLIGAFDYGKNAIKTLTYIALALIICIIIMTIAFVSINVVVTYAIERIPILRLIGQIIFGIFTFSIPVWLFITQPLYERGKQLSIVNKLKKTGAI